EPLVECADVGAHLPGQATESDETCRRSSEDDGISSVAGAVGTPTRRQEHRRQKSPALPILTGHGLRGCGLLFGRRGCAFRGCGSRRWILPAAKGPRETRPGGLHAAARPRLRASLRAMACARDPAALSCRPAPPGCGSSPTRCRPLEAATLCRRAGPSITRLRWLVLWNERRAYPALRARFLRERILPPGWKALCLPRHLLSLAPELLFQA